jgi:hypothetical protein
METFENFETNLMGIEYTKTFFSNVMNVFNI